MTDQPKTPQQILDQALEEFEKKFTGQTQLSQAILSAMEYRGFYDAGKYLDDDISNAIMPIILSWHTSTLQAYKEALIRAEIERLGGMRRTREDTIPAITNNPRFIETVEQQNIGWNASLQDQISHLKELLITL